MSVVDNATLRVDAYQVTAVKNRNIVRLVHRHDCVTDCTGQRLATSQARFEANGPAIGVDVI